MEFEIRDTLRLDSLIAKSGARRFFFDEIDQFEGWEKYVLQELFDDIVYRDVIVHNKIRETGAVRELAAYLVENPGCRFTASKMLKPLNVASASTISQWCEWMQNAYLFFFVPVFTDSAKARMLNPKKVYCVDTGMEYAVSSRRIPNDGARFENLVFLALRRRFRDIAYFDADGGECDFVVKERHAVSAVVQACIRLTDECKDREIGGLLAAMDACSLPTGTIVTGDQRDTLDFGRRRIDVVPFWDWCR